MSEADRLQQLVEKSLQQAAEVSARAQEVAGELARLSGIGRSDDGGVRVVVDHRGIVTDIEIAPVALRDGVGQARADVLEATEAALADLRERAAPIQARLLLPEDPLGDTDVLDAYDRLLTGETGGTR